MRYYTKLRAFELPHGFPRRSMGTRLYSRSHALLPSLLQRGNEVNLRNLRNLWICIPTQEHGSEVNALIRALRDD